MNTRSHDTLILFGELFQRGYANGLVEAAQKKGINIVYSTVGRRDENQKLRPLTSEEIHQSPQPLINLPLECGFDLEPSSLNHQTPVEMCKDIGLKEGIQGKLNLEAIIDSQKKGVERFRHQVRAWSQAMESYLQPEKKILIAHLMAGGVPRAKIILSLMNRVFKGTGDRFIPSLNFWNSDLGQFCQRSFFEVTANSFNILIEETSNLRKKQESTGGAIHYSAYGYHGTNIYFKDKLQWLCYTPYLQGFAKKELENFSSNYWSQGVKCTVYNCPEILTNSSSIFPGVEIFLYLLFYEIQKRNIKNKLVEELMNKAEDCLLPNSLEKMHQLISQFIENPLMQKTLDINHWPQHSNKELMELMLKTSDDLIALHKNPQQLMTGFLSEIVIKASGEVMLQDSAHPLKSVYWLGHDTVIKYLESLT